MAGLVLDGSSLTLEDVITIAHSNARLSINKTALDRVVRGRRSLERLLESHKPVYGVNTGFGALSREKIPDEELAELQVNLIRSHAASIGKPHSAEIVRTMMLLRANALLKGNSGVKPETVELLVSMLNEGIHPVVPEKGSVGASGDLSPLSHIALVMIGEGEAEHRGKVIPGGNALKRAGLKPLILGAKEGLALNNGTQQMTAIGCLTLHESDNLLRSSIATLALSLQALNGWTDAFDKRIHQLRRHAGQERVAATMRELLSGSRMLRTSSDKFSIRQEAGRPQDPYSFRCAPQVMGTASDMFDFARKILEVELNSVTDNPLVFPDAVISGGNFHGQPVSAALDILGLGLSTIGSISERRISALLDSSLNNGLPPFLVGKDTRPGLASGLMAIQYTAAALVAENKLLAHPASSDSIPTSANFEDYVSMGPGAGLKCQKILENTQQIVAIELITALQAIDSRAERGLSRATLEIYRRVRRVVPYARTDRSLSTSMKEVCKIVAQGEISDLVRKTVKE